MREEKVASRPGKKKSSLRERVEFASLSFASCERGRLLGVGVFREENEVEL